MRVEIDYLDLQAGSRNQHFGLAGDGRDKPLSACEPLLFGFKLSDREGQGLFERAPGVSHQAESVGMGFEHGAEWVQRREVVATAAIVVVRIAPCADLNPVWPPASTATT